MDTDSSQGSVAFGEFQFYPSRRQLLRGGEPVRLGSRCTDILSLLVAKIGTVVSKDELVSYVWPDIVVDDGNLRVHLTTLRKTLGDGIDGARYIATVPNRGYAFVAELRNSPVQAQEPSAPTPDVAPARAARLTRVYGRGKTVASISEQLAVRRLITIVGAGGVGKTTVANAVMVENSHRYQDGVAFIELGSAVDADQMVGTITLALGCSASGSNPQAGLVSFLAGKQMLLVLDNCEQVVDAAADLVEALLHGAPQIRILATSREPLRADGEWLHRLSSLEVPPADVSGTSCGDFPSVQLFANRLASAGGGALSATDLDIVADICRQLDGIPLALELAAARADVLGLSGVASRLDDRFRILTKGRRMALPRHQTLQAAVDWSYQLLTIEERRVFERLSVFPGKFDIEAAIAVARGDDMDAVRIMEAVANLVAKSLVATEGFAGRVQYRMLNTFRAFGMEMLRAQDGEAGARTSHALYVQGLLTGLYERNPSPTLPDTLERMKAMLDDARSSIDWALSSRDAIPLAVELTALAIPLGLKLALLHEFGQRVSRAIVAAENAVVAHEHLIRLHIARGHFSRQIDGSSSEVGRSFEQALELARQFGSHVLELNALFGMWSDAFGRGDYRAAERMTHEVARLQTSEVRPFSSLALRIRAQTEHFLGRHEQSLALLDASLRAWDPAHDASPDAPIQIRPDLSLGILRSRILWMRGRPNEASVVIDSVLEDALGEESFAAAQALAFAAVPLALWRGQVEAASLLVDILNRQAEHHASPYWRSWAELYGGVIEKREVLPVDAKQRDMLVTLLDLVPHAPQAEIGSREIIGWAQPEALRVTTIRSMAAGLIDHEEALRLLKAAADVASGQGNLAFELRSCLSMATLVGTDSCKKPVAARIQKILAQYEPRAETPDLHIARAFV